VLATGGLSIPKLGASGLSLDLARRFGLGLRPTRPALVPLTLDEAAAGAARPLSGVSVQAVARCGRHSFREGMLFTHRGLSGPAILQVSSPWRAGEPVLLDLVPDTDVAAFLLERKRSRPRAALHTVLAELLPARLAQALATEAFAGAAERPMADLPDRLLRRAAEGLKSRSVVPNGTEGYAKAEVMIGGIDTAGLSSRSMMARDVPGLFAVGEAVDVTGWLGGYNFQWAWSSGWCAGQEA